MNTKCPLPKGFSGTKRLSGILFVALALLLAAALPAVAAPFAYITNFVPGTVSIIDASPTAVCRTATHTPPCVVKVLNVGPLPGGVAVNPAGTFAYVANKDDGTLSVIDVATNTVAATVPVGPEPWGVAVNADGSKVFVSLNGAVAVVDAPSLNVTPISLPGVLNGLVVVGSRLYVADATAGEVVAIDTNNPTPPFTRIPVGTAFNSMPMGLVANPAGTRVYVADLIADFVSVFEVSAINTATNAVEPTETVTIEQDSTAMPGGVAVSPDGTLLYVTNDSLNQVTVVTLANKSLKHVAVGIGPIGVATDPAGRAYVVNTGSGNVSIVDPSPTAVCTVATQTPPCVVKTVPSGPMSFVFGAFTAGPPPPAQYALAWSTNGSGSGSVSTNPLPVNGTYTAGTVVTLTATPAGSSEFTGWSGACSGSANPCSVTMNGAKSVTATFTLKQYSLTWSMNGTGSGSVTADPPGGTYGNGTVVSLTATPAASSQFTGWSGACSGTGACSVTMDASKSVTATFTLKQYSLTWSTSGNGSGSVTANPGGGTYDHGVVVSLTATPAASSLFTGWSGACTGAGACSVTMDAAKSVTATFTLKQYSLSLSMNGTGSGSVTANPPGGPYNHGTVVSVTAAPAASSQFSGWSGACTGTGACNVTMDAAKSVTATFTLKQYLFTMLTGGNGASTANPAGGTYVHGTFVALTATPAAGFQFTSWSGACSGLGTCNVLMDAAKSVTATFTATAPAQFTLTLDTVGSGSIAAQPPAVASSSASSIVARPLAISGKYNAGTLVSITATAAPGYKFTGWSGGCTGTGACSVMMDADKSVIANFTVASEPPSACEDKIKDWQKKVADHKHPWWHNYQLRISLKMYAEALAELGRAKAKVGDRDKRYVHAQKELNDGKSALCHGHYWRADNEFWDAYQIAHQILKQFRR